MEISTLLVEVATVAITLYTVYGVVYRLYLSPIAHFPGRKLAALTFWYEFYFDVIKRGSYVWEIEEMHKIYGPIIRINPYELHVIGSDFVDQLYPSVGKNLNVEKWSWSAAMFGSHDMTFGTVGHKLHRRRRGAFSNFFSKASVQRLQPVIQSRIDVLCRKLEEKIDGEPVDMVHAYSALTQDVITEYCFSDCKNVLEMKDFSPWSYELVQQPSEATHMIKQFPYMLPIMDLLPDWWVHATNPLLAHFRTMKKDYISQIKPILAHADEIGSKSHATVFHSLRDNDSLPPAEKSLLRLVWEAQSLVGAGTLTTTHMMGITTYHILANPSILERLLTELEKAIPDATPGLLQNLEQLPYLSAVISEGLRVSYGLFHRLQRVHPDNVLTFREWIIPPGTPVAMDSLHMHNDPAVFPEPRKFDPSRFMGPEKDFRQKHLFNFGRGTRQCVGMNLALAEIHLTLATVFRRLGKKMRLYDTDRERDVDVKHDFLVTNPSLESRGVRVAFHSDGHEL